MAREAPDGSRDGEVGPRDRQSRDPDEPRGRAVRGVPERLPGRDRSARADEHRRGEGDRRGLRVPRERGRRRGYAHAPTKPTIGLEYFYEKDLFGGSAPYRKYVYWQFLGGIAGGFYGNEQIWRFDDGTPGTDWTTLLSTQARNDAIRQFAFWKTLPWHRLKPSGLGGMGALVTAGGGTASPQSIDYVAAACTLEGDLLLAYVPPAHTGSVTIDMTKLAATAVARWFDPTNGTFTTLGPIANTGTHAFTTPGTNSAGDADFLLVLQTSSGAASGTSTATAVGQSIAAGPGTAAGTSTAAAGGGSIDAGTGTTAGTSTASAAAAATLSGAGSAAGTATAGATGAALAAAAGTASGTSSAATVGAAVAAGAGSAVGASTASGDGAAAVAGAAGAGGSSTAAAAGSALAAGIGTADGTSTAAGAGAGLTGGSGTGSAAGTSTAAAGGASWTSGTGNAAGTSTAMAVSPASAGAGMAAGTSDAAGGGASWVSGVGSAAGTSTASASSISADPTSAWEDAIYQWVLTGSGLAPSQVIWADVGNGGPAPAGLYISMRIIDVDQVSDDWLIPRREGGGIVHHVRGTRHPMLELRCFAGSSTGARRAELVLARVMAAVMLPSVAKALRKGDVGVGTGGPVRVLPGVRSGMLDPLAMVTVQLHIKIDVSEAGGEFVSVDVTTPGGVEQTVTKP